MLELAVGLDARRLEAIGALEQRVIGVDGGRLKLEWGALHTRAGSRVEDLLWWQDGELLGYCGLHGHGTAPELVGMVDPAARQAGIASSLLTTALSLCRERGTDHVLLIVPGARTAGHDLARSFGGVLDHSEHALALTGAITPTSEDPRTRLRPARADDVEVISGLLQTAFGHPVTDLAERLASPGRSTMAVERDGAVVGTLAVVDGPRGAGIYGFAIDPAWQGRGIGRDALARTCHHVRAGTTRCIGLEVAVDNDRALGLYTSLGFTRVTREDYYVLATTRS